jgi:NAD(P)-dependent dehydrogenase (short-subunit alcohol dehydrogenase family)
MSTRPTKLALALGALVAAGLFAAAARRRGRLRLAGRVAIVTGGGRGLGLAIARELVKRGCRVAIGAREEDVIERAVAELRDAGGDVMGAALDASDRTSVEAFVAAVHARHGRIDVLVNNAGQCFVGPASELEAFDLERAFRNIFWVQYHPTMAVLPHLRARRFGRIANVTSFGGKVPVPHQAAYVACKYAATGWSATLATELSREGIRVSTIAPPPIRNGAPLHVHLNGRVTEEFGWFTRALTSPVTACSAERVARAVVDALEHGDFERTVTPLAWFVARAYGAVPNVVYPLLCAIERLMPSPAAPGTSSIMRFARNVVENSDDAAVRRLAARAAADERRYLPGSAAGGGSQSRR